MISGYVEVINKCTAFKQYSYYLYFIFCICISFLYPGTSCFVNSVMSQSFILTCYKSHVFYAQSHSYKKLLYASSCPSIALHQCGSHSMDFHENLILETLMKICASIQIRLKSCKISGTLHDDLSRFYCCRRHEITIEMPTWIDVASASITDNV